MQPIPSDYFAGPTPFASGLTPRAGRPPRGWNMGHGFWTASADRTRRRLLTSGRTRDAGAIMSSGGQPATIERSAAKARTRGGYAESRPCTPPRTRSRPHLQACLRSCTASVGPASSAGGRGSRSRHPSSALRQIGVPGPNGFAYGIEQRKAHVDGPVDAGSSIPAERASW